MISKYYEGSTMNYDKISKKLYSHKYNDFILSKSYISLTKIYFVHPNDLETIYINHFKLPNSLESVNRNASKPSNYLENTNRNIFHLPNHLEMQDYLFPERR